MMIAPSTIPLSLTLSLLSHLTSATTIPSPPSSSLSLSLLPITPITPINPLLLPNNNSSNINDDQYAIDCDGSQHGGYNLDAEDCLSALHLIIDETEEIQFADRHSRAKEFNMAPLPWRWMGIKASCYFEVLLKPGAEIGTSTLHDIRGAAYLMIGKCAMGPRHQGGIANKIPGDNNLLLTIGRYVPGPTSAQCTSRRAIVKSCREVMYRIPAYTVQMRFGPHRTEPPRPHVELPWTLGSSESRLSLFLLRRR
ncbi:MAG: hypothetical protein LQ350_008120 [Teloschistes chrysophthalmus]|nr:MAG: hypothetical protein LQ350_008120 [Niorma chrysophthalma]